MVPEGDNKAALAFLRELFPKGPWLLTAICDGIESRHFTGDQIYEMSRWIGERNGTRNLYFSIGEPLRVMHKKAERTDIKRVCYLHVDVDPRVGEDLVKERERILRLLQSAEPKPTHIIDSGGGYWGFWQLAEPIVIDGDLERAEEAARYNKQLEQIFGADSCHDISRIARLPGTVNIPDAKKLAKGRVPALAMHIDDDSPTYQISEFTKAEPAGGNTPEKGPAMVPLAGEATYTLENLRNAMPCAITELRIPDRAKDIALNGCTEHDPPEDTSRSGWLFSLLTTCTRAGIAANDIASLLKSDELHQSLQAHINENGGDKYMLAQIGNAQEKAPCVVGEKGTVAFSEDHLAMTFAKVHAADLRYCALVGKWFHWTGTRWEKEETLLAWDQVKEVLRLAADLVDDDKVSVKRSLLSKNKIAAIESLARSDRRMAIKIDEFDADPMLLNTPSGIVDLCTGELMPHDPEHYMTKQTAVGPEDGPPERFLEFLTWATAGDQEFVAYIRRIMGYCLTGSTKEHALFFLHGAGGNGKSVLQELLQWLMADYATSTTFDTLAMNHGVQHPTDLASMKGARLVVAPETESNQQWAEAKIKRMTGGDRIAARFMRQDFFEYVPQFKLFVVGNHRPGFTNIDKAIKRRIHLLPFTQEIAADQVDRDLGERLKRKEGGKILAWAIAGVAEWLDVGLKAPNAITSATDDYLESEDLIQLWLDECTVDDGGQTEYADLYKCYRHWSIAAGERPLPKKRFGMQLNDRGWPSMRGGKGKRQRQMSLSPTGWKLISEATGGYDHYPEKF